MGCDFSLHIPARLRAALHSFPFRAPFSSGYVHSAPDADLRGPLWISASSAAFGLTNSALGRGQDWTVRKSVARWAFGRAFGLLVADTYFCRAKKKQEHHIFITNYTPERPSSKTLPPVVNKTLIRRPREDLTQRGTHDGGGPFSNIRVYLKFKNYFLYYFFLNKYTNGRKLFWFTELYFITHFGCPGLMFCHPQHFPPRRAHRAHFLAKLVTYLLIIA